MAHQFQAAEFLNNQVFLSSTIYYLKDNGTFSWSKGIRQECCQFSQPWIGSLSRCGTIAVSHCRWNLSPHFLSELHYKQRYTGSYEARTLNSWKTRMKAVLSYINVNNITNYLHFATGIPSKGMTSHKAHTSATCPYFILSKDGNSRG